jgi:hypothetical protein
MQKSNVFNNYSGLYQHVKIFITISMFKNTFCEIFKIKLVRVPSIRTQRASNINKTTLKKFVLQTTEPQGGGRLASFWERK